MRDAQWTEPTQFKQWTPEHILRHLHCWNEAADWAVHAPEAFRTQERARWGGYGDLPAVGGAVQVEVDAARGGREVRLIGQVHREEGHRRDRAGVRRCVRGADRLGTFGSSDL